MKNRPYQDNAQKDIEEFLNNSSFKKGILVSPTATGKSIYPSIISKVTNEPHLVIQPNLELLEQNVDKARIFGLDPSIYSASVGSKEISNLTYATPMSMMANPDHFKHFKKITVDECFSGCTRISCIYNYNKTLRTLWEDKYIRNIVLPNIRSYNIKEDIIEEDEIINIKKTGIKKVYNIYLDTKKIIKCTLNHPFLTNNGWKKISDITKKDFIITSYNTESKVTNSYLLPNSIQEQIIIGSEIGDGNLHQLSSNKIRLRIIHCEAQKDYLEWKNNLLWDNKIEKIEKNGYSEKIAYRFSTKMFYKFFDSYDDLLSKLDILGIAILYMDDGSFSKSKNSTIYSMCDEEEKVIKLNNRINEILNIKGVVRSYVKKESGTKINYIVYRVEDTKKISKSIREYIPEVMQYKLREEDRGFYKEIKSIKNTRKVCKIDKIEFYKEEECFDIEVKKNSNFIICKSKIDNGEIAHNCHLSLSNKMSGGKVSEKGKLSQLIDYIEPDKIIGMTASPIQLVTTGRGSELKMIDRSMRSYWYKSNIFHITQIEDIKSEYWADVETVIIKNDKSLLTKAKFNSPEFEKESIIKQYEANNLQDQIIDQYERLLSEGIDSVLTFVPSVEQAVALKKRRPDFGIVYDKTPKKERKQIVEDFKSGKLKHLINCMVFTAGFDHPKLKAMIIARETMSLQLFYQIYGRLVRNIYSEGILYKKKGKIIDLTGNSERFGDISTMRFEKNDYTNGWGLWNNDRLLTGYPFGDWDMPHRSKFIKNFENKGIISKNEKTNDIEVSFGKDKGQSLIKSFEKDPNYYIWVFEKFDWTKPYNKKLHKPLENLIEKHLMHGR